MRAALLLLITASLACAQAQSGKVYHGILATGQSLSTGCQGYAPGQVTSGTPYSNLMLSVASSPVYLESTSVPQLDALPLQALANTFTCNNGGTPPDSTDSSSLPQEYPGLAAVNQLSYMTGGASGNLYVLGQHGSSGRVYSVIGGPTDVAQPSANPSFADGQTQLSAMSSGVTAASSTFVLDAVMVTHGESDDIAYNYSYEQNLNHFQLDYETISNAAIGRRGLLPMFIDQPSSWGFYHGTGSAPVTATQMWRAAEDYPGRIYLVGPIYQFPGGAQGDGVHKSPAGYRALGELYGKAMYQVLVAHQYWIPLMPQKITRSGSQITATFFVPGGSLAFDTTTIAAQTNNGFEFADGTTAKVARISQASGPAPASVTILDGGSGYTTAPSVTVNGCSGAAYTANLTNGVVTSLTRTSAGSACTTIDILFANPPSTASISSMSVSGNTVTINLNTTPTGPSPRLRYAYTAPAAVGGGKGNLRDTDTTQGRTSGNLYDWCVTFDAPLPFVSNLLNGHSAAAANVRMTGRTSH